MPPEGKSQAPQSPLKQIRTFQGDVADALSRQQESLYSLQAKEHSRERGPSGPTTRSTIPLFIGSLLLLAVAGGIGWFAYNEFLTKTAVPTPSVPASRFLSAESSTQLDIAGLGRDDLIAKISEASQSIKGGALLHLDLREGTTSEKAGDFFSALGAQAPGSLVRALEPVFMMGAIGEEGLALGASRFIIFKLSSYENAFGGMLNWEKTMASDIGPLFATSEAMQALDPASVFKDVVYRNKDIRALYGTISDPSGATTTTPRPSLLFPQ